jgi:DNA-binding CsgD family transcriptional regulator
MAVPARIPAGVRETILRRLRRLSARCNELLGIASVFGRQFTRREICAVASQDMQAVLSGLEPAIQAGLVEMSPAAAGTYQFTHALIRDTLYGELPTTDRLQLHARAGDALVNLHADNLDPVLSRIAHHYHASSALGECEKAIVFALRAAESAVRIYAYEAALVHYGHAIETLESGGLEHDERFARAYVLKGSALKQLGLVPESIDALLEAINRTRLRGSVELLVDVLMLMSQSSSHVAQRHIVRLLERSLALLPVCESPARAKALATHAFVLRTLTHRSGVQELVDEALAMANRCCDDGSRCACYQMAVMALRGDPASLPRRLQLGDEHLAAARSTSNDELLAEAYHWQALNYLEAGQLAALEALLDQYGNLSTARFGLHQYQSGTYRATLALLRGEWEDMEARIERLLEIGNKTRRDDAHGVYGSQMFALNRDLGRLQALAPQVQAIAAAGRGRVWEPGLMLTCCEIGKLEDARRIFEHLADQDFRRIVRDDMYVTCLVFCAETCCALADAERARTLYELLLPYQGQTANHPTAVCFGATDLYLAMLAAAANRPDAAQCHFERAAALNRAMRAWPWLARTLFRHGAFLLAAPSARERGLGEQQLREAEALARRLQMARLMEDIDALLPGSAEAIEYPDALTAREVEVLRLLSLGRTNKDVSLVLSISLNTVATHVRSILNKTHCANRTEAAAYAIQHGLREA